MSLWSRRVATDAETLSSVEYNRSPSRLRIAGAREEHPRIFSALARTSDQVERAKMFHSYMLEVFGESERLNARAAHLSYILGWMLDSNGREGAALKGWAFSRFGLEPTWHKVKLKENRAARDEFEEEVTAALKRDPTAFEKFDLIYEFAQSELAAKPFSHIVLYRGTGHLLGEEGAWRKEEVKRIRLNSLNSFTRDFERAWEFGDRVLEASIPLTKVFFDDVIFRTGILTGEEEVIVLGGEFEVGLRW